MGWLADLFAPNRATKSRALDHTTDAFALPLPTQHHSDAFNPPLSPALYTYPPQGAQSYGYVPTSAGLSHVVGSASILPTHMDPLHSPLSSRPTYPPLTSTWARIRAWLSTEYPELGDTLNYGILPADLAQIELQFGFALPQVVRESYLVCDGQEAESAAGCSEGLFFGLTLLPLEAVFEEWRFWREVDNDPTTGANERLKEIMSSIPTGWVRNEYSQKGWIPLIADRAGNYIGVDLNPAESGIPGQVIVFGRDFDTKVVLWRGDGLTGWAKWLASFAEELESGDGFEVGPAETSDDSEDELGYESYFYDGRGRGQGDGGGDTGGVGGLRLTGEYKGWNVMEAWADRSLRKWYEAGVITDTSLLQPEADGNVKVTDDVDQRPDTEAPVTVLADVEDPMPLLVNGHRRSQIPTISVTKPPVPRPVGLPTVRDIEEGSPTSLDYEESDLEAGRARGHNHKPPPIDDSSLDMRTQPPFTPVKPETEPLAGFITTHEDATMPLVDPLTETPVAAVRDLLVDSARSSLDVAPMAPTESALAGAGLVKKPNAEFVVEGDRDGKDSDEEDEDQEEPPTTIKLVGGGGSVGVIPMESQLSEDSETVQVESAEEVEKQINADVESVAVEQPSSNAKGKGGRKRTMSVITGIKRLSQFGGEKSKEVSDKSEATKEG